MRAQLDTAIGMILTLTIVAAVLVLAVWGFFQLTSVTSDAAYEQVYSVLGQAGANHASFGSRAVVRINPPEPFCVFNQDHASAKLCVASYTGHEICDSANLESYWDVMSTEDGNVVFRSGLNDRLERVRAPEDFGFACFRAGSQQVFVEGHGRHVTISPMREIRSIALHEFDSTALPSGACGDSASSARLQLFTSSAAGSSSEFIIVRGVVSDEDYCLPSQTDLQFPDGVTYGIGPLNTERLVVSVDPNGEIVSIELSGISAPSDQVILIP